MLKRLVTYGVRGILMATVEAECGLLCFLDLRVLLSAPRDCAWLRRYIGIERHWGAHVRFSTGHSIR